MMDGMLFKSGAVGAPPTPAGDMRRLFTSSSVRVGSKPRRFTLAAPGPLSSTKALKVLSICTPLAAVAP